MSRISGYVVSLLVTAVVLSGCAGSEATVSTVTVSQPTLAPAVPGLECEQGESMLYDHIEDVPGSSSLESALTDFGDTSEGGWLDQLSRSETIKRPRDFVASYRDADGRPAGLVYLERRERGWLVVGWDRCV